jgi:hypothetical protein
MSSSGLVSFVLLHVVLGDVTGIVDVAHATPTTPVARVDRPEPSAEIPPPSRRLLRLFQGVRARVERRRPQAADRPSTVPVEYSHVVWGLPDGLEAELPFPGDRAARLRPPDALPYAVPRFRASLETDLKAMDGQLRALIAEALRALQDEIARGERHAIEPGRRPAGSARARVMALPLDGLSPHAQEGVLRLRVDLYEWHVEYGMEYETFARLLDGVCAWYGPDVAAREALSFATRFHAAGSYGLAMRYYALTADRFSDLPRRDARIARYRVDRIRQCLRSD